MKPPFLGKNMFGNPHAGTVSGPFKQSVEAFIFMRSEICRPPDAFTAPLAPGGGGARVEWRCKPHCSPESEFMLSSEGQINTRDDQELGFVCTESQGEVC